MNDALVRINLDDLVTALGWQKWPVLRAAARFLFQGAAEKFADQMLEFDRDVGQVGLSEAARRMLKGYVKNLHVFGLENLPAAGPALILSNHPGMTDTLCLFSALGRSDLLIIALRRPFLQALPNVSKHLIFLDDDPSKRIVAVRQAARHLRSGGALLTFPAGRIEPDPDVYSGAWESLANWLDSAGIFVRFAPDTKVVPVLVRSVLWDRAVRHPLTRLRSGKTEREQLGASLQLLAQILFKAAPVTVKLQAAPPLLTHGNGVEEHNAIHTSVLDRMRTLLLEPPIGEGTAVL
jgi:hypothetical protein